MIIGGLDQISWWVMGDHLTDLTWALFSRWFGPCACSGHLCQRQSSSISRLCEGWLCRTRWDYGCKSISRSVNLFHVDLKSNSPWKQWSAVTPFKLKPPLAAQFPLGYWTFDAGIRVCASVQQCSTSNSQNRHTWLRSSPQNFPRMRWTPMFGFLFVLSFFIFICLSGF